MRIDHTLRVAAPASLVWEVVTDLASYPAWNPFVVECESDLAVGSPISMRVRIFERLERPQREEIFEHVPGERLCYGLRSALFGALSSLRCHVVAPVDPALTHYEARFELRGPLAPVVARLLGARLARGFESMPRPSAAAPRRSRELGPGRARGRPRPGFRLASARS